MTKVTCAISGISFSTDFLEKISIPHTQGYFHPVFACTAKQLYSLYSSYRGNNLTPKDSYLLFLAFLHSTDKIKWKAPASLNPNDIGTKKLIAANLESLLEVIAKTAIIKHPSFSQPNFVVAYDNNKLVQIPAWIKAWKSNIIAFHKGRIDLKSIEDLQKVENKLSHLILSGESPERFTHVVANWACQISEFPPEKEELWKQTIRSCFNITKMFNTPLPLLIEIKEHCEVNIEVGSIHFHTLMGVIKKGITKHATYLGGSITGYTLLPTVFKGNREEAKNKANLLNIISNAPREYPQEKDYTSKLDFLRAKLAYSLATKKAKTTPVITEAITPTPTPTPTLTEKENTNE